MAQPSRYHTKHRQQILEYAKKNQGKHITAAQMCEYFRQQGKSIGLATIYRQLEHLVEEGLLHKYIIDSTSSACFEYREQCNSAHCIHCKCIRCGAFIHVECSHLEDWNLHLQQNHRFQLDFGRTMLYGVCENCAL